MLLFIVGFLMLFTFVVIAMLVSEIECSENITVLELVCAVREKKNKAACEPSGKMPLTSM